MPHSAPRHLSEFFNSLIAVWTSSNVNADTAHRACFCARAIAWSSASGFDDGPDAGVAAGFGADTGAGAGAGAGAGCGTVRDTAGPLGDGCAGGGVVTLALGLL